MSELSELLKNRREEQKKTLAEVSSDTKIRIPFLESIEKGDFKSLPSYLHAYGFVKQYAEYLGFSYDEIKELFGAECPKDSQAQSCQEEAPSAAGAEEGGSGKILVLLCVLAAVCAAGWFGYSMLSGSGEVRSAAVSAEPARADTAETASESGAASVPGPDVPAVSESNPAPVMQESLSSAEDIPAAQAENGVQAAEDTVAQPPSGETVSAAMPLGVSGDGAAAENYEDISVKYVTLTFTGDCWVLFVSDTGETEDFVAEDGTVKRLPFIKDFTIDIGNAAAISMRYGTQNFTGFGREGAAVKGLRYSLTDGALVRVRGR